jgi:hypothetical protein
MRRVILLVDSRDARFFLVQNTKNEGKYTK